MTELYWWILGVSVGYLIMSFGYACWSETNNVYRQFSMDLTWGMLWPIILVRGIYRLPGRVKAGDSGIARVIRDVWNG